MILELAVAFITQLLGRLMKFAAPVVGIGLQHPLPCLLWMVKDMWERSCRLYASYSHHQETVSGV